MLMENLHVQRNALPGACPTEIFLREMCCFSNFTGVLSLGQVHRDRDTPQLDCSLGSLFAHCDCQSKGGFLQGKSAEGNGAKQKKPGGNPGNPNHWDEVSWQGSSKSMGIRALCGNPRDCTRSLCAGFVNKQNRKAPQTKTYSRKVQDFSTRIIYRNLFSKKDHGTPQNSEDLDMRVH